MLISLSSSTPWTKSRKVQYVDRLSVVFISFPSWKFSYRKFLSWKTSPEMIKLARQKQPAVDNIEIESLQSPHLIYYQNVSLLHKDLYHY